METKKYKARWDRKNREKNKLYKRKWRANKTLREVRAAREGTTNE